MKAVVAFCAAAGLAYAQLGAPAGAGGSGTAALQLPVSGRPGQGGSVAAQQNALPGTTTSVNTINSTVQVTGPYAGSLTGARLTGKLSLHDAIERALKYNLGGVGLTSAVRQSKGQARVARSALLPNLNGSFRENYLTEDLQALGIRVPFLPAVVGPFSYFDLRATLTQNLVDMTALNNHRAAEEVVKANEQSVRDARDLIVLTAGGAYLQVIAAEARVESAKAQLETAKQLNEQTIDRRRNGVASQIDVNRTMVQQQTQQQRLLTLQNDQARQKINLARIAGLPANDAFGISDQIGFSAPPPLSVDEALKMAMDSRSDLKAAEAQVRAAERSRAAARSERLPSLAVTADLGEIGPRFSQGEHTYTVAGSLRIPIWQGGRAEGDIEQASAALDQRRAEVEDIRGRIESDVRNAFLDLSAAASQLDLARTNSDAAKDTLRLTREKFETGVSEPLEVTQAVEAVANSELDYITALFAHNLAKLSLARAMGQAEQRVGDFLKVQ